MELFACAASSSQPRLKLRACLSPLLLGSPPIIYLLLICWSMPGEPGSEPASCCLASARCPAPRGGALSPLLARATDCISPHTALRSPLSMSSPYSSSSFGMMSPATLNGELPAPSMYLGIHLSPQVSSAVLYGRSPMVSLRGTSQICWHMLALALVLGMPWP